MKRIVPDDCVIETKSIKDVKFDKFYGLLNSLDERFAIISIVGSSRRGLLSQKYFNVCIFNDGRSLRDIIISNIRSKRTVFEFETSEELANWLSGKVGE